MMVLTLRMPASKKPISYVIFDYVLSPEDKLKIEYKGPNPFRVYGKIPKLLQDIFYGRGMNIFEESFKWDITDSPPSFYFKIRFDDAKFDRFTRYQIYIKVFGAQPSDLNDPNGLLYMEIMPVITTTYEFSNVFEKSIAIPFIWMYHKFMYNNVRRRYMQMLKERTFRFAAAIRSELGIPYEMPELSGAASRVP